jgi:hypothetical protein
MSKDAIMNVPDGYMVRFFGKIRKDDLEWASLTERWQPVHLSLVAKRIDQLPSLMVARKRREHD